MVFLLVLGVVYCIHGTRRFFADGICCMPTPPPKASSWMQRSAAGEVEGEEGGIKSLAVIVNPNAGLKKGEGNLAKCKRVWDAAGINVNIWKTTHAGHAREMARDNDLDGLDALCVIGGDGSIHELVNGLLARKDGRMLPVGFLPGGSGNSI